MGITSGSKSDSPLDGICLSASEKAAVLTLIREEVRPGAAPTRCHGTGGAGQALGRGRTRSTAPGSRVCCLPDNHEGDRSQRVEEEIRREPSGSLGDEVKTFGCVLLEGCCALCLPLGAWVGLWGRNGMTRFGVSRGDAL